MRADEQATLNFDVKFWLPVVGLILTIVGMTGGAGAYLLSQYRCDQIEARDRDAAIEARHRDDVGQLRERQAADAASLEHIQKTTDKIHDDVTDIRDDVRQLRDWLRPDMAAVPPGVAAIPIEPQAEAMP